MHAGILNGFRLLGALALFVSFGCSEMGGTASKPADGSVPTRTPMAKSADQETARVPPQEGRRVLKENAERMRDAWKGKTFEEFKAQTYQEPFEGGKYIVNGDTPILNEKQLREFFENLIQQEPEPMTSPLGFAKELIVNRENGQDTVWNTVDKQQLSYCVSTAFGNRHQKVVSEMEAAAQAWSTISQVKFIHAAALDGNCTASTPGVVFDVRPVNVNGQYLARAFFPNEPRGARNVLIDNSAFSLDPAGKLTLVGILRHELGHTLGWRHEHTRPDSGTCFEDNNWRPLTSYDPFSVMHYPQCNGKGDWALVLTSMDKNGAACLYGPAEGFSVDPALCPEMAEPAAKPCQTLAKTFSDQQVSKNAMKEYGPFPVVAGTVFEAKMLGAGGSGDPDLYVRFGQKPTKDQYTCRPYTEGPNENCSLDVPGGKSEAFIMVNGYTAAKFHLVVLHTPPGQ